MTIDNEVLEMREAVTKEVEPKDFYFQKSEDDDLVFITPKEYYDKHGHIHDLEDIDMLVESIFPGFYSVADGTFEYEDEDEDVLELLKEMGAEENPDLY